MSVFKGGGSEEACVNAKAFEARNWPGDFVIRKLAAAGRHMKVLVLHSELYDAFKEQMGNKFDERVYSVWGKTRIKRGKTNEQS